MYIAPKRVDNEVLERPVLPRATTPPATTTPVAPKPPTSVPPPATGVPTAATVSTLPVSTMPVSPPAPVQPAPLAPPKVTATPMQAPLIPPPVQPAPTAPVNVAAGIDTSPGALMPDGFSMDSLLPSSTPPDAQTASAHDYVAGITDDLSGPTPWNVTPEQTVAGQYAALMEKGNPAIEAARASVIRANAASGGNNSLMAQTAAGLAGSQVALSIAVQDANTFAQAGQFNAAAANSFAEQKNTFVMNATLSQQNFEQGVALLKDQTTQAMVQLYGQVRAHAATASMDLKAQLDQMQAQSNATLAAMDKTFAQNQAAAATQENYAVVNAQIGEANAQANAATAYGMNVRMSYLSNIGTQQAGLMQTIASIQGNPNISPAQAQAGVQTAVDQFNSFMNMNNAYYSSLSPDPSASNPAAYLPGFPNN